MFAAAYPTFFDSSLITPRPPLACVHLLAHRRTTVNRLAVELICFCAVVVPAAFLCSMLCEVDHQSLTYIVAMDDRVPLNTIRPGLHLFVLAIGSLCRLPLRFQIAEEVIIVTPIIIEIIVSPRAEIQREWKSALVSEPTKACPYLKWLQWRKCKVELERGCNSWLLARGLKICNLCKLWQVVLGAVLTQTYDLWWLVRRLC
mmetsp:Transcript_64331/g.121822  ORF Transcript_64331/g.121822 Transcript_64331/m.121822 type:complete len:202 (-) Transcript_64331:735-1340(-)